MRYILERVIGYAMYCSGLVPEFCSNLVDPASSHMLVLKINPCMCKYKYCTAKLRMAHYISYNLFDNRKLHG